MAAEGGLPAGPVRMPNAKVTRAIPKPFQRPRIEIGGAGHPLDRREWREIAVRDLHTGDIVPGIGLIQTVKEHVEAPPAGTGLPAHTLTEQVRWTVTVRGGEDNTCVYHGADRVLAFTAAHTRDGV
jgi:hypothetical protein